MPTNKKSGRVLLLDAISPRTVTIARSLGKRQVQVTCADETFFNLAFYSRYCDHRFTYPSPERQPKAFVERLLNYLQENPQDCLISVKEETLDVLLAHRQAFEQFTRLPYPDNVIFQTCRDKYKTMSLAAAAGIPHPHTSLAANFDQVQELAASVRFPVVIKPRSSYSGIGIRYAQNEAEMLQAYREVHSEYPFPMVQEEIPAGEKFDVACLQRACVTQIGYLFAVALPLTFFMTWWGGYGAATIVYVVNHLLLALALLRLVHRRVMPLSAKALLPLRSSELRQMRRILRQVPTLMKEAT